MAAVRTGLQKYGLSVSASRITSGNHRLYRELERCLSDFFGAEDALVVSGGYQTNLIVAQSFARCFSHALIDERAHPSLSDASRFLDCPVVRFKHRDPLDLQASVRRCGPGSKLILLTDGMFSHDGSTAPLAEYLKVLPSDGLMLVDDAHGGGLLGKKGRGSLEHNRVRRDRIIQTVTLSKAFGSFGGAILGTRRIRQQIFDHSSLFVGSTPLPLPLANAALVSIRLLKRQSSMRKQLQKNSDFVKTALRQAGFNLPGAVGPIVPLHPDSSGQAAKWKQALLAAGIYPPFTKYPNGPANGYFRFVISSEHSRAQLDKLVDVVRGFR
jgi:7-keto-8-aminopelargonate synthetase-like enzyme